MCFQELAEGRWPVPPPCEAWAPPRAPVAKLLADVRRICATHDAVAAEAAGSLPGDLLVALFDAGLFMLTAPQEHGGLAASASELVRVIAALAEHDPALAVMAVPHLGNGIKSVALFGSEEQKAEVFAGLSAERRLISFAITEASAGSDVAAHRTRLTDGGSGGLLLAGSKTWITNVPLAGHLWDPLESTCRHASLSIL